MVLATYYIVTMTSLDGLPSTEAAISELDGDILTLNVNFSEPRLWNYTVHAYGCPQHPVTKSLEISKNILSFIPLPEMHINFMTQMRLC